MYSVTVTGHLDSGHYLRGYQGKCANPHGHRFTYQITISKEELDNLGMLIDFTNIKDFMKGEIEELLDHKMLNEVVPFTTANPTAENLAHFIYDLAYNECHKEYENFSRSYKVVKVRVYESPDAFAEYWE